ncbi:MAG: hypothetical protein ETSY1_22445 [Candidatus Entotheonella factor]|uniref:Uncharacterized protein n=1 Tax=Entotheonella factor TaxID=1429438 RepID=W4LJH4_ENTF1|nr:MAG: hypothetical protein ETSY1_22445 [Candidatus Entotheonella factor]
MEKATEEPQTAMPSTCGPYAPAKSAEDRLAALRALRGMWKGRNPDPVEYFEHLRQESEREVPARKR